MNKTEKTRIKKALKASSDPICKDALDYIKDLESDIKELKSDLSDSEDKYYEVKTCMYCGYPDHKCKCDMHG